MKISDNSNISIPEFDLGNLLKRMDNDYETVRKIISIFTDDVRKRIDVIRDAILRHDFSLIASEAHTIKGSAATIGAESLRVSAEELERLAVKGCGSDVTSACQILYRNYIQLIKVIEELYQDNL